MIILTYRLRKHFNSVKELTEEKLKDKNEDITGTFIKENSKGHLLVKAVILFTPFFKKE